MTPPKSGEGITGLPLAVFREGLVGYYNLRPAGSCTATPSVLTLIDFGQSSQQKRLWVIDVAEAKMLFHTLVAHGKASGTDVPMTGLPHQSTLPFKVFFVFFV